MATEGMASSPVGSAALSGKARVLCHLRNDSLIDPVGRMLSEGRGSAGKEEKLADRPHAARPQNRRISSNLLPEDTS